MKYPSCHRCKLNPSLCYGVNGDLGLAGCTSFDHKLCKEWGWTCVCNPALLSERLREVDGFECVLRNRLCPTPALPHFIPTIHHRVSRNTPLGLNWAAVPLHVLFVKSSGGMLRPMASTAAELRAKLGLRHSTRIVVTGPGPDQTLEDFWGLHRSGDLLHRMVDLEIELFTVPNFSFFFNSPPLHYRYNRSRILRVTERASRAGLNAVLHLNALHELEWQDWEKLLVSHPEITTVCLEFQTGYSSPVLGIQAFNRLVRLQDHVGRPLHPILVGGARFAMLLGQHFRSCTIIDAQPFQKTFRRQECWVAANGGLQWKFKRSRPREDLAGRFMGNLVAYSLRLEQRLKGLEPVRQTEFAFGLRQTGPLRPVGKQRPIDGLPLFENSPLLPRSGQRQQSQSRSEPPTESRAFPRSSTAAALAPAKLTAAATRANSGRKRTRRTLPPNVFGGGNTADVAEP